HPQLVGEKMDILLVSPTRADADPRVYDQNARIPGPKNLKILTVISERWGAIHTADDLIWVILPNGRIYHGSTARERTAIDPNFPETRLLAWMSKHPGERNIPLWLDWRASNGSPSVGLVIAGLATIRTAAAKTLPDDSTLTIYV